MFEKNWYKQIFPANDQGHDFIVGDLHGCRSLLDTLAEILPWVEPFTAPAGKAGFRAKEWPEA